MTAKQPAGQSPATPEKPATDSEGARQDPCGGGAAPVGGTDAGRRAATASDAAKDPAEPARAPQPAVPAAGKPEIVVVTGMSGAGRTEALHILEDLGYFCIDNLPPTMILQLTKLFDLPTSTALRLAVVCDTRSREFFGRLREELGKLADQHVDYRVLFLDADDETLLKRYSSLRRRHPMARGSMTVSQAIAVERERLTSIRELANVVIDTSHMRPARLRKRIAAEFSDTSPERGMNVSVFSFGFKYGVPYDADIVIDVRFLPNPFYDPDLRDLTGSDAPVRDFVMGAPETTEFMGAWERLLDVVMPGYVGEGKQHLSIAVGCTGGQHRSVAIAEATGEYLLSKGYLVTTTHRDVARRSEPEED
ncbi:MAG: RNase adapter RapZ [Coriobacteriales bacterium]|jgi:UPF0042 nucleotide-binding protein